VHNNATTLAEPANNNDEKKIDERELEELEEAEISECEATGEWMIM